MNHMTSALASDLANMCICSYMQNNPDALTPFAPLTAWSDPTFSNCFTPTCYKTFGLRFFNSTYVLVYGAGLYSFFNNYDSGCILTLNCQQNMVSLEQSEGIYLFALNTEASEHMVEVDLVELVPQAANTNGFCQVSYPVNHYMVIHTDSR